MFKIGLISTHGTGKTTLAHLLAGELKKRGFKTKIVSEVSTEALEGGLPINQGTTLAAQAWILHKQIAYELQAMMQGYEVLICDRTVLDNYLYLERAVGRDSEYLEMVLGHAKKFPYDALFYLPSVGKAEADGVRATEESFQKDMDRRLDAFLKEFGVKHTLLPHPQKVGREDWVEAILSEVLPRLGKA
jgi:nicotinamide riboside kinase